MSDDALIRQWEDAWNSHDVTRIRALFTEDAVYEDIPFGIVCKGDEVTELFRSNFRTFGADFKVSDVTGHIDGDHGVIRWTMSGTQIGDLPGGMNAKNTSFSSRGVSVFDLRGGRIAHNCDYWDALSFLRQLGHL
jgi:steroid delta-isomerase-like uncharacterized protein